MKTTHTHHIIPRHIGGTDDPSNLVELTVEEHAEAHRVLFETYGRWQDEVAWKMLSGQINSYEASQQARVLANLGNKHFEGKTHTEEARKKISDAQKVNMIGTKRAIGHIKTEECKQIISDKLKGNTNKNGKTGYTLSDETKKKMSESRKGDNNPAKRADVREKLRQAALLREAKKRELNNNTHLDEICQLIN